MLYHLLLILSILECTWQQPHYDLSLLQSYVFIWDFNPIALRKAKIVYNFGLFECNKVKFDIFFAKGKKCNCMARQCWLIDQNWWVIYNQSNFHLFSKKQTSYSIKFFSAFHWSPSTGKSSYDSSIFCQDYKIIMPRLWNHTRAVDWVTIWVVHITKWMEAGLITAWNQNYRIKPDCAGHA